MAPAADQSGSFVPAFPTVENMGGSPLYCTGEESLKVTVFNAAAGVSVTIAGRTLAIGDTRPSPFKQVFTPTTDRSASTSFVQLPPGWLLNAQVFVSAGTPAIGQTFARLSLVRGMGSIADEHMSLAADYITAKQPTSYPGSSMTDPTDGAGAVRSITGATPSAGAEISETVPTGARWELLSIIYTFVTSAAVANRFPDITLDDGANVFFRCGPTIAIAASTTQLYNAFQGAGPVTRDGNTVVERSLPIGVKLLGGYRIRTTTLAIQAADAYTAVQYLVREWVEGQ